MADYKTPQWLLPNEKNLAYPATGDGITGSGLSEDRHSLYSMDFNGTDYISAPNTFLNSASVCTLSFWMKGTGEVGGGAPWNGIQIQAGATTTSFRTMNGSNINNYVSFSPGTDWHHYLGVYVGGSYSKLYIDGVLKSTLSTGIPATLASTSGDIFKIGYGQSYSVAKIDEVALWNRQLTDGGVADGATAGGEIATIYNSGSPGNLMGLSFKPIAYYPLGEQAQMGSANWSFPNGSLQSHVIDFDSTDYVSIPHVSVSSAFSVSAWVKTTDAGTYGNIFSSDEAPTGGTTRNWQVIRWNAAARFILRDSGGSAIADINGGTINDGNWHHVLATWDGTTGTNKVQIYVDGNSVAQGTASSTALANSAIPLVMGGSSVTWDFIGDLSNIAIWNSDQSTNLNNIYNNGSPQSTYTTTPTAWWKLNAANSSYVYPWLVSMTGDTDYGSGNGCFTTGGVLKWIDTQSQLLSEDEYFTFTTQEVNYSGSITLSTTGGNYQSASSQLEYSLEYKVDQGSWTVWKTQVVSSGTSNTAWTATDVVVNPTSTVQVRLRATGGLFGSSQFTLNDVTIGGLYTETFAVDNIGYTNNTITQPPVNWTFIDTETPAPNYTSALDFVSADSDYIEVANNSSLQLTDNLTLSCWINADNVSGTNSIIDKFYDGADRSYLLRISGTRVKLYLGNTDGSSAPEYQSSSTLSNSVWYHIVTTFSSIDNEVKIYINGSLDSTHSKTDLISSNNEELRIGTGYNLANYFDGSISNCSIYSSALSAAQVQTLYNSGTPETAISFSPVSWWKLDNTTTGIQDSGSASNNGTNNGATQIATNVLISNNGESDTLPTSALIPSDLQFESPYSNYSLSFDGTSSFMGTTESILPSAGDMTVSAWVKLNDTTSLQGIFESANYYTTGFNGGFGLRANGVGLSAAFSNGTSFVYNIEPAGFTIGDWFHVAFTFNNTSKLGTYYVNGSSIGTHTFNAAYDNADLVNGAELGRVIKDSNYILNGNLDEVSVFSSVLTQAQITQIYNNSYPADLTSLSPASWWRLGEDAYFVGNTVTIPNKVVGGATMSGNGTQTAILVGDAPGSYANGSGTNLAVEDRIGDAPESTANSVSINMIPSNRISYPAGYTPTQVDNVYSMAFDGTSDYVLTGLAPASYTGFSISAWVYADSLDAYNVVASQYRNSDATNSAWFLETIGSNMAFGVGSGSSALYATKAFSTGGWYYITGVWNGSTVEVYIDGVASGSPVSATSMNTGTVNMGIGALWNTAGTAIDNGFWNGKIDEVAIFNYALSERQIKQDIYEGTTTGKTADLNNISNLTAPVAWYRMGD